MKQERPGQQVEVWFQDEARFGQQGTLTNVWALKGTRPTAVKQTEYEWVYLYASMNPVTGESVALLTDIVTSFKVHGFKNIMLIGDSGGNGRGMGAVATRLNAQWNGDPVVAHISQHYDYGSVDELLKQLGVVKDGQPRDGLHDDPGITMNMMVTDPNSVRWEARVKAGLATINGVSIADKAKALEIGKKIVDMRATNTAAAIKAAIANKGKTGGSN